MSKLVSTNEASHILGVHRCTVQRYVQKGWLRRKKMNGRNNGYLISDLGEFIKMMQDGKLLDNGEGRK